MGHSEYDPAAKDRRPWNAGRKIGVKRALKPQQVWAIRLWLGRERRLRYRALMNNELEAITLTEPYITVAERAGCRIMLEAPYHGTEVASPEVDGETYAARQKILRNQTQYLSEIAKGVLPGIGLPSRGR